MAWVFLTERYAWKLKKPVWYEFLDFSTLEARYADSQREVKLNRRLAPDVYLGVVPLRRDAHRRMFLGDDREGEPVEWLAQLFLSFSSKHGVRRRGVDACCPLLTKRSRGARDRSAGGNHIIDHDYRGTFDISYHRPSADATTAAFLFHEH